MYGMDNGIDGQGMGIYGWVGVVAEEGQIEDGCE